MVTLRSPSHGDGEKNDAWVPPMVSTKFDTFHLWIEESLGLFILYHMEILTTRVITLTTFKIFLVWFEHILLNILSKGWGTSSQTYFALSLKSSLKPRSYIYDIYIE